MLGESTPLLPVRPSVKKEDQNHEAVVKEIGTVGSFTLVLNNMVGPAMLGFPQLFQQAGLIPTSCCIIFIYLCATLSGTLFSDAISAIPGNKTFDRHVDFSSAFNLIIGYEVYVVAETLFLITCAVQAITAIVESAQSVDGFLASFLIGKTYAVQFYPTVELVTWVPDLCLQDQSNINDDTPASEALDCTPFSEAGGLVLTLGFVITTAIFLPWGRGHLKETIFVQIVAFTFMCLLLTQFTVEFIQKGFPRTIPMVGDQMSQLAGVVLFNYAYIVTVPAWLMEKKNDVSVNTTIWSAGTLSSAIYFGFGIMCAKTFGSVGGNALVMLASTKVQFLTRLCAALFGVTIIGSGVPVFCVMIRTAIYHTGAVSYELSLFLGSVAPYLVAWTLYQGGAVTQLVNWTGLTVNGCVAFLLPMYLVIRSLEARHLLTSTSQDVHDEVELQRLSVPAHLVSSSGTSPASELDQTLLVTPTPYGGTVAGRATPLSPRIPSSRAAALSADNSRSSEASDHLGQPLDPSLQDSSVQPLPPSLEFLRLPLVVVMMVCFTVIIGGTIFLDIYLGIQPS